MGPSWSSRVAVVSSENVLTHWREHTRASGGSRWYGIYSGLIVTLILAPVIVSVSASLVPSGADLSGLVGKMLFLLPVMHLVGAGLGRYQGPAVRRSSLAWVIAWAPGERNPVFRRPVAITAGVAAILGALTSAGAVIAIGGFDTVGAVLSVGVLVLAGLIGVVGVSASVLAQLGSPAVLALLPLIGAPVTVHSFVDAGTAATSTGWFITAGILVSFIVVTCSAFLGIRRLEAAAPDSLIAHSVRWERASAFASNLDAEGARNLYFERPPHLGRTVSLGSATASGTPRWWHVAMSRALVGVRRRPGRVSIGFVMHTVGVGLLVQVLVGLAPAAWALPAVLLMHGSLAALSPGLKEALTFVNGSRVFGVSDATLVFAGALPGVCAACISIGVALSVHGIEAADFTSKLAGTVPTVATFVLASLGFHIAAGLRGPLPVVLYTPIATGMGDPSVLLRLAWPFEAVLMAGSIGYAASIAPAAWAGVAGMATAGLLIMRRWRRRD